MEDQAPVACSLSAEDHRHRLAAIQEIGRRALLAAEDRHDGAVLSFRNSAGVREELLSIVDAESSCCSFLALSLVDNEDRLMLSISGPGEALRIMRDLTESFRGSKVSS